MLLLAFESISSAWQLIPSFLPVLAGAAGPNSAAPSLAGPNQCSGTCSAFAAATAATTAAAIAATVCAAATTAAAAAAATGAHEFHGAAAASAAAASPRSGAQFSASVPGTAGTRCWCTRRLAAKDAVIVRRKKKDRTASVGIERRTKGWRARHTHLGTLQNAALAKMLFADARVGVCRQACEYHVSRWRLEDPGMSMAALSCGKYQHEHFRWRCDAM